jgi:hypothetical protein
MGAEHGFLPTTESLAVVPADAGGLVGTPRPMSPGELSVLSTDPTERFDRITLVAQRMLGVTGASINVMDHDLQRSKSAAGWSGAVIPRSISFCTVTMQQPGTLVVPDTLADERFRENPLVTAGPRIRAYAGHPLLGTDGIPVGTLCVANDAPMDFTPAQIRLLQDLARWAQDELALVFEMAEAGHVQQSLLPAALVSLPGYETAGVSRPIRAVGGDFFDWYPVPGGAAFTFADVMGKGVAAALIAATVRAVMRGSSRTHGATAAVESAAEALDADLEGAGVFVTMFHAHLDERTGVLRYIDAGHGLTLLLHADGTTERLASTGLPLGVGWDTTWEEASARLMPGDLLISVSDGVLDAFGGALDALATVEALARATSTARAAVDAVAGAAGSAPDDVSVIAVRRDDARM